MKKRIVDKRIVDKRIVDKNTLNFSAVSHIFELETKSRNLIDRISSEDKIVAHHETFDTMDDDINQILKINLINKNLNSDLFDLYIKSTTLNEFATKTHADIDKTIDSLVLEFEIIKKPEYPKLWWILIGLGIYVDVCLLIIAFSKTDMLLISLFLILVYSLIFLMIPFKYRIQYNKKLAFYNSYTKALPQLIENFKEKCSDEITKSFDDAKKAYNDFVSKIEFTISELEADFEKIIGNYNEEISKIPSRYSTLIKNPSLVTESINVIVELRANTLTEALNVVKQDRHLKQIEKEQREQKEYAKIQAEFSKNTAFQSQLQTHYAEQASLSSKRAAEAAEKAAEYEKERNDIIKRSLKK